MDRSTAVQMGRADPLARFRDHFVIDDDGPLYMDGNSLGRPPRAAVEAVRAVVDRRRAQLGAHLATPRRAEQRGAHVSVYHPLAWPWCRTLIGRRLVVPDFRTPDVFRLAPAPIYTRFVAILRP